MESTAELIIDGEGGLEAGVVQLAAAVSLAAYVDRALLRSARLHLLPGVGVEAEGRLWLSPMVGSRGADGITLRSDVAILLQAFLANEQPAALSLYGDFLLRWHTYLSPILQLQEKLTYWGWANDITNERIESELRTLLTALEDPARWSLAGWVLRNDGHLPPRVRELQSFIQLKHLAVTIDHIENQRLGKLETKETPVQWQSLVKSISAKPVRLEVSWDGKMLELARIEAGRSNSKSIVTAPDTSPVLVEIRWRQDDAWIIALRKLPDSGAIRVRAQAPPEIWFADGTGYAVEPRQTETVSASLRRCFVIQGFGKKQDYQTGRTLDLDASYEVIKEAVVDAGLECIRADEIKHRGTIDQHMFEEILEADLVIADLSTYNVNSAYLLGVRHALRPFCTIIVAETGFKYPFDFSHIAIRTYEHMGPDISRREAKRFHDDLLQAIEAMLTAQLTDSPVYTLIPDLRNPMRGAAAAAATTMEETVRAAASAQETSLKTLTDQAKAAIDQSDFVMAKAMLLALHQMVPNKNDITQMFALATYQSKQPTPEAALREARGYLDMLDPSGSHNTATLGLWGDIHKRMWDLSGNPRDLDEAVRSYERGFQFKQDFYSGINLAFLLNARAQLSIKDVAAEAVADWVLASRVRRRVVEISQAELMALPAVTDGMTSEERAELRNRKYWILATLQEAAVGFGDPAAENWKRQAADLKPATWMLESTEQQIARLHALLAEPLIDTVEITFGR